MSYKSVYVRDGSGKIQFPVRSIVGDVACAASPGMLSEAQQAALMADLPCKVKTVKKPRGNVLTVHLSSASQARQLGYACAQAKSGDWMAQKVDDGQYNLVNMSTAESFLVTDGKEYNGKAHVINNGETKTVEISFRRPSVRQYVGEELGLELPITLNVHKATNNNRQAKLTPWTWYHILARYLCDERVSAVDGEFRDEVEWGFRLESFKLAGGNPASVRRLSTVVTCEKGFEFEAFYQGAPNNIPVLVDTRFVEEEDFAMAAVTAIATA